MMNKLFEFFQLLDLNGHNSSRLSWVKYQASYSVFKVRLCYVLAIALYSLFSILDSYMAPVSYKTIWLIRFALVVPLVSGLFAFSFSKHFVRFSQLAIVIFVFIAGGGVIMMIDAVKPSEPAFQYYYAGLILVLAAQNSLTHLKAELGLLTGIFLVILYNYVFIRSDIELSTEIVVNNNFFLLSSVAIGYSGSKATEYLFQRDYFQTQKLMHSNLKLDELNNVKTRLLSILSHDLRSPILNIKSAIYLLRNRGISKEEFQHKLGLLLSTVSNASSLLDNLLTWSSTHFYSGKITRKNVHLRVLTDNVIDVMSSQASQKEVDLYNEIDEHLLISVEPSLLETVLRNLLSNAIKFTEKGYVKISAEKSESTVMVKVQDTGVGMPESIMNDLFSWDRKVSIRGTKNERGSGIGLLISKEFIEMHQGKISVESEIGKGTAFYFTIGLN